MTRELEMLVILIPCFNEEKQLPYTLDQLKTELAQLSDLVGNYQIIFVDDGSKDRSWEIIRQAGQADPRIKGLRLSRNFGKEAAWLAGLHNLDCDCAILMDCDLQHPPKYFREMILAWKEGYDLVEGVKSSRGKESFLSKLNAKLFYSFFEKITGIDLNNASDFKLLDRKVINSWQNFKEHDSFFRGLAAWVGYKRTSFEFEVASREHGHSRWTFFKLLSLSLNALTGFSAKPLLVSAMFGLLMLVAFVALAIQTLVNWCLGKAVAGFTTVILLQLLIGASVLISLGLTGIYLAKVFNEVKARPRYLIMDESNFGQVKDESGWIN